ncbi:MAG: CxxxxCH/CxxCH domain-containing protein [Geobacteraceae bacterium]|nr:CxxxxCH/CxxCH domain-containing protein [Geobacteraceae bacterium]
MRFSALLLILGLMFGCSKANENAPILNPVTGKHPAGWAVANTGGLHPAAYLKGPSSCLECHGKNMDGGISSVSCFSASRSGITCHPGGPSGHPQGWSAPNSHGAAAKAAYAGRFGFLHCSNCHGVDYNGGVVNKSCFSNSGCHVKSPHPSPWQPSLSIFTHTNTDASNAAACIVCHASGNNFPHLGNSTPPATTPPAGTPAGCFNNTLCHGVMGHNVGWSAPNVHGASAKGIASGDTGFKSCTQCHGTNYGTILYTADIPPIPKTCLDPAACHSVAAPHPPKPWRTTGGVTHINTDTSNADQCAICHTGGQNSGLKPITGAQAGLTGCYNNTLCHGQIGHPAGWSAPTAHGATAKKAPSQTTGFSSCQLCHGAAFVNGSATTCFKGIGCHGFGIASPHPQKPWFSRTGGVTHSDTDPGNVDVCAICHTAGANSTIKPPFPQTNTLAGCYNNTLCHFHQIPFAPPPLGTMPISLHSGEAKKDLSICQACHGKPGTTAFDGVLLADGTRTIACSSCHTYAKAHPTDWQGSGTYSHRDAGNKSVACAICHGLSLGAASPLPAAPSCFSASFTNPLGQARTCHANGPGNAAHTVPYVNHNSAASANITYCLGCHSVTGSGSNPNAPACTSCHISSPQASPSNCVSCHAMPPSGPTYPNINKSHTAHSSLNVTAICAECHSGLGAGTYNHYSRSQLRTTSVQPNPVKFGTLAKTGGVAPTFTLSTGVCANTYCHGATLLGGSNPNPVWGDATYLTGCGVCHGFPPSTPEHTGSNVTSATPCMGCHPHVNATNTGFTDPTKHINGVIDASGTGHAFPYSGALHQANGATLANCSGCHDTTTTGGTYPVAAGVRPLCSGCHLNMTGFTGCWDCHGASATNARPNGSSFPNRVGYHNVGDHAASKFTCTTCHPITSGSINHGWSNRIKSTRAQVNASLRFVPANGNIQSSCNPSAGGMTGCHGSANGW